MTDVSSLSSSSSSTSSFAALPVSTPPTTPTTRSPKLPTVLIAPSSATIKCPELVLRGVDLQSLGVSLVRLQKKGKRFDSPWQPLVVGIYGTVLFYFEAMTELPRGIVPLVGCTVKSVDRIYRTVENGHALEQQGKKATTPTGNGAAGFVSEACGPCFKVTSRARRVLLFRCASSQERDEWVERIQASDGTQALAKKTEVEDAAEVADFTGTVELKTEARSSSVGVVVQGEELHPPTTIAERDDEDDDTENETDLVVHEVDEKEDENGRIVFAPTSSPTSSAMLKAIMTARHSLDSSRPSALTSTRRSLDEMQLARIRRRRSRGQSEESARSEQEMSQMLRDAMVIMNKQKEEIQQLRTEIDEDTSVAQVRDALQAEAAELRASVLDAVEAESCDEFMKLSEAEGGFVRIDASEDVTASNAALTTSAEAAELLKQIAPEANTTSSHSDILQRQAMELAEIARSLQLQFQSDVLASVAQASASTLSDDESEHDERLSDFDESDAKFLESSGLLASVHMNTTKVSQALESVSERDSGQSQQKSVGDRSDRGSTQERLPHPRSLSARDSSATNTPTNSDKSSSLPRTNSADPFTFRLVNAQTLDYQEKLDLETLLVEKDMRVVSSLLQTATREEKTKLLFPLLRVFGHHERMSRLLRWAIETEVSSVINVATLFRSDDYASRLVSTYSKAVGSRFIRITLSHPVREICRIRYEDVDLTPKSGASGESITQRHADTLMKACQMIIDSIMRNKNNIPLSYFHICSYLNDRVIRRFDGSREGLTVSNPATLTQSVIGGFLFLRFICPAITAPHMHDLVHKEPEADTKRVLVQMTRLLIKTATSVMFDDKQPQFRILNPFIERNTSKIRLLFKELAVAPSRDMDTCIGADSQYVFTDVASKQLAADLSVIESIAEKNVDAMEEKLAPYPETAANVRNAVLQVVKRKDPFRSQRMQKSKMININFFTGIQKMVRKYSDT